MPNQFNVFFSHPITFSYYFPHELLWSQADYILLHENGSKLQLPTWDFANGQNDVGIAAQADGENVNRSQGVHLYSLPLPQPRCDALPSSRRPLPALLCLLSRLRSPALNGSIKWSGFKSAFGVIPSTSTLKYGWTRFCMGGDLEGLGGDVKEEARKGFL